MNILSYRLDRGITDMIPLPSWVVNFAMRYGVSEKINERIYIDLVFLRNLRDVI